MKKILFALASALLLSNSALAQSQEIQWLVDSARAGGSGCSYGDTLFVTNGNEVDVIFNTFALSLDGYTGLRTDLKTCRIDIPAYVRSGVYLAALEERFDYGIVKTYGTTAALDTRAWFYGYPIARKTVTMGRGSLNIPATSAYRTSNWAVQDFFCRQPNGIRGIYINQISMSGQRDNLNESLSFATSGLNVRWHARAVWYYCR